MDGFEMVFSDLMVIEAFLDDADESVVAAWRRLRGVVLAVEVARNPLPGRQGAGGACAEFAQYLDRMGSLPRADSEGMELLLFRWVQAAEEMTRLLERVVGVEAEAVRPSVATAVVASIPMDEAWQVSYCDSCGAELAPSGGCGCDELPF